MLSKQKRYSREDFPKGRAYKSGRFLWGTVSVYESPTFKAGVVVSKKVLRMAVERNKARRRVYSAIDSFKNKNIGVIIRLRKEVLTTPCKNIISDIEGLF